VSIGFSNMFHRIFYERFREKYPWLPTRIVKGAYRDAVMRTKSFRKLKKSAVSFFMVVGTLLY
jgi:hypothetical protein